ncbi:surface-adhesin E family protein [Thiobacter aerophilum]|uniref:Surface-adhesin E family protein n=1 Tax=Thiobacter aerophilum TaxID=3121275 RepID=A0ABV0EC78_9BURK
MRWLWLFACLVAAAPVLAADWMRLPIRAEDQYFYDRSKLVIQGEEITYWKKVVFRQPPLVKGQAAAWALMRERIHCGQHTLRLISYVYYASDGTMLDYMPEAEKEATPIIPDTLGDAFERHLCVLVTRSREEDAARKKEQDEPRTREREAQPLELTP